MKCHNTAKGNNKSRSKTWKGQSLNNSRVKVKQTKKNFVQIYHRSLTQINENN